MSVEWYELFSGDFAAMTPGGVFLWSPEAPVWRWHPYDSDRWDAVHQAIYRNHRAEVLDGPPAGAPPLPEPGPRTVPHRDDPGAWATDPRLIRWVGEARSAWLVLHEDLGESSFGDGVFRYVVGCFPTEQQALEAPVSAGCGRHLRRIALRVSDGRLQAAGERLHFADRYAMPDVLADLARRIP